MITEDQLEQHAIQWFQETGWNYASGADLAPEGAVPERVDFRTVVLKARPETAVHLLNPKLPSAAVEEVAHVVTTPGETSLAWNNRAFHRLPMDGVKVEITNAKIHKSGGDSRTLATLRDTLLPKLLSGELTIRWTVEAGVLDRSEAKVTA